MPSNAHTFGLYQLIKKLSIGGMGEIYLARRQGPHGFSKRLVIKRMRDELKTDREARKRFAREARVAAKLEHPNIVSVFNYGEIDSVYFLAMEYIDGINLARLLKRLNEQGLILPHHISDYIAAEDARSINHLHEFRYEDGVLNSCERNICQARQISDKGGAGQPSR